MKDTKSLLRGTNFIILLIFLLVYFPSFSQTQNPVREKLKEQFQALAKNGSAEVAYIQTNKGIYERGEDLWFKVCLLDAQRFTPCLLSKTLYLQVINEKTNHAIWQEKYEIKNGFADGHVFLPDSLSEGTYLLAAYTQHSFLDDSTELKAVRKILVREDMNPKPSITATFNQPFYYNNQSIQATITVLSDQKQPITAQIDAELIKGDKKMGQCRASTNEKGVATLVFLPQSSSEGLRLVILVKYAGKEVPLSFTVPSKKNNPIQFDTFPEGGIMVAGIKSKIAFKAINVDGMPLDIKGALFEDNVPLLEFKSTHAGMGSLDFTPLAGKKYHIRLSEPALDSTFLLPEVNTEGITMRLAERDREYLNFIVSQSHGDQERIVYLRVQIRGIVYCIATGALNKDLEIKIPLKEFPWQGIAECTLFNENLLPLAERLVYIDPSKKLYIETKLNKKKYETREEATLKITVKDENGLPVKANLGISVYDKLYQNAQDPENILTHYYLSTQLKGKIYDPAYYFDSKNVEREKALDLLMLTHGWRRYVWSEATAREYAKARQQVIFDGVKGKFETTKKRKKASSEPKFVKAFNPGENKNIVLIRADSTAAFMVAPGLLKTWQGGYVYLKPLIESRISLTDPFETINRIRSTKEMVYPIANITDTAKEEHIRAFIVGPVDDIKLDEVTIKGKAIKPFRDKYMGRLDSLAKFDFCKDYVVETCGLINCPACGKGNKPIEGKAYPKWISTRRDVGPHSFRYYANEMENIIYHYPDYTEEELMKMNNLSRVKAYYIQKEFYQPRYDKETENYFIPDSRNTLVWAPSVITDEKGEASLEFFCSDINTGFVGNIEGVGNEGLLGTQNFEFTVQKMKSLNPLDKTK